VYSIFTPTKETRRSLAADKVTTTMGLWRINDADRDCSPLRFSTSDFGRILER
jgi:hypothetical protein